jgi:hypothetical protein|tara:strand:+ start:2685 stop:2864 length:180 start_codon:yes stop_codon:yes gene_type:complete
VETKDRRILAYLKNAISETLVKIEEPKNREDLIDEVMKLRNLKRSELTLKHIIEQDDKK